MWWYLEAVAKRELEADAGEACEFPIAAGNVDGEGERAQARQLPIELLAILFSFPFFLFLFSLFWVLTVTELDGPSRHQGTPSLHGPFAFSLSLPSQKPRPRRWRPISNNYKGRPLLGPEAGRVWRGGAPTTACGGAGDALDALSGEQEQVIHTATCPHP